MRNVALLVGFVASYLILDWVSYIHPLQSLQITPWNPQAALAIGLVMLLGQRWLPAVAAAVLLAELLVRGAPHAAGATLLIATVLTLGYGATAQALVSPFAVRPDLERRSDILRLIAVTGVGTLVTAALYISSLSALDIGPRDGYLSAAAKFWIGDFVGVVVTLPLLLMVWNSSRRRQLVNLARRPEVIGQGLSIVAVLWLVFGWFDTEPFKYFYLLFLPLVWSAVRHGTVGAAVAVVLIQAGLIVGVQVTGAPSLTVFELQALHVALAITGLLLGVTVDERQRAADQLERASRFAVAGRMAAAIAHELNQPLTAVTSYAKASRLLATSDEPDRTRLDQTLVKAIGEARRAAEIVQRVRDLFTSGMPRLVPESGAALLERAVAGVRERAESIGARLSVNVADPRLTVQVDALQMDLVLRNLLVNAIESLADSNAAERAIDAGAASDGADLVRLWVHDTGPGVKPELRDKLFEPIASSKLTGMGMGLAISRSIVEAHGGRLLYAGGPGARFVVELPMDGQHGHI